jgi:hypothetical protein
VGWRGYKAHLTQTCEPDRPHLIVHVATTVATTADIDTMPARHADLAGVGLLPAEHLVDASYVSVDGILAARADHGVELVGPLPPDKLVPELERWRREGSGPPWYKSGRRVLYKREEVERWRREQDRK